MFWVFQTGWNCKKSNYHIHEKGVIINTTEKGFCVSSSEPCVISTLPDILLSSINMIEISVHIYRCRRPFAITVFVPALYSQLCLHWPALLSQVTHKLILSVPALYSQVYLHRPALLSEITHKWTLSNSFSPSTVYITLPSQTSCWAKSHTELNSFCFSPSTAFITLPSQTRKITLSVSVPAPHS